MRSSVVLISDSSSDVSNLVILALYVGVGFEVTPPLFCPTGLMVGLRVGFMVGCAEEQLQLILSEQTGFLQYPL